MISTAGLSRPMFARPKSLEEAVALLASDPDRWTPVHGGTDLLVRMRGGFVSPCGLLDLTGIPGFGDIRVADGCVVIGAGATHAALASDERVRTHAPALARAAGMIGSPAIRNRGTLGGNLANASPAADTVPPLFVLGAEVALQGPGGTRWVPIEDFATGPGRTVRAAAELITAVRFPARGPDVRSAFQRLGTRKALAIARVSVAVGARVKADGTLREVRVALGAVGPTVLRARETERILEGARWGEEVARMACEAIQREALPITDLRAGEAYRREMCGVLLRRAVGEVVGGSRGRE